MFFAALKIIEKFDKVKIQFNKKIALVILILTIGAIETLGINIRGIFSVIFIQYMIIIAYIDYKTKTVYTVHNLIMGVIILIYFWLNGFKANEFNLVVVFLFIIITTILCRFKFFGDGDNEVYILTAFFFLGIYQGGDIIQLLLVYMFLANLLFFVIKGAKMLITKVKNNNKLPFVPYMASASIFLIFLC